MSEIDTKKITDRAGTGAPSFTYGLNITGADSGLIGKAITASGSEPSSPANGDLWYDSTNDKFYYYAAGAFKQLTHSNAAAPENAWSGSRGLIGGGEASNNGTSVNVITYIDISSAGDATDFGDLTVTRENFGALSNQTRGVFAGGQSDGSRQTVMDYVTISTIGNATDFGDLQQSKQGTSAASNGTIGIIAGGRGSGSYPNYFKDEIDKITVATTGNATDFGNLVGGNQMTTAFSDSTRGVIAGGYSLAAAGDTVMQYITFDTTGNTTDFGDLTVGRYGLGSCSDATRGLIAGGAGASSNGENIIDYVTTQTTANATDFGDLTQERETSGMANSTYGVFVSGRKASTYYNVLDYVTIQTAGNAADFGDNTATYAYVATCSGAAS